jgi:hypothetical protein
VCRKLVLSGCPKLTDHSVVTVARNCPDIKEMQLAGLALLTGTSESLVLWRMTCITLTINVDEALQAIGENCPLLEFLTLSQLQLITDEGLLHLGRLQQIKTLVITQVCSSRPTHENMLLFVVEADKRSW